MTSTPQDEPALEPTPRSDSSPAAQSPPDRAMARGLAALRVPNYRRYLIAETVSLIGTWLQFAGQLWLVVQVLAPGNGFLLGVTSAVQAAPILLTLWGGAIADSLDRRRILIVTQSASGVIALALGLITLAGAVTLPIVLICAFLTGLIQSIDAPAQQAMVPDLVGSEYQNSAVALSGAAFQGMRIVGFGLAPVLVAAWGLAAPFLINAATFVFVVITLLRLKVTSSSGGQSRALVKDGIRDIRREPLLVAPLLVLGAMAVFALNFDVTLPLFATHTLRKGLWLVSALLTSSSSGAVISSFLVATRHQISDRVQWLFVGVLAASMCALAVTRTTWLAIVIMFPLGGAIAATMAGTSTLLLHRAAPSMRGRIMSVYGLIMQGSALIGGLLIGALSDPSVLGPPGGLFIGAAAIVAGIASSAVVLARAKRAKLDHPMSADVRDCASPQVEPDDVSRRTSA
jgi:MFS family permease